MTAAVILAAGASTRLGSPKQLINLDGETLLDRTIRIAHESDCSPILVLLGASAERIEQVCDLKDVKVLFNNRWAEGMASSIRLGIQTLAGIESDGALLLTCDMPSVTSSHLRSLQVNGVMTASRYAGRNGIPAFFPRESFTNLLTLEGDRGAREILRNAPFVDLISGDQDIDTPDDLSRMLSQYA